MPSLEYVTFVEQLEQPYTYTDVRLSHDPPLFHFIRVTVVPSPAADTTTSIVPDRVRVPLMLKAFGEPVTDDSTNRPPDCTSTFPLARPLTQEAQRKRGMTARAVVMTAWV